MLCKGKVVIFSVIVILYGSFFLFTFANAAIVGDINGDGQIDLSKAIYALQVSAGLYPGVSTSCLLSGRGEWRTEIAYVECDVISSGGENYVCNSSHTSSGDFNDDIANWNLLSLKGEPGPAGPVGQAKGLSIGNEVARSIGGKTYIWLDRDLGANRVAESSDDSEAYGDLYQWGRGVDGHESRTSPTTTILSTSDYPKHDNFIIAPNDPNDWREGQNNNLWSGVNGINNPCPAGFRLPTNTEWDTERAAWVSEDGNTNDSEGAFASPLHLVVAGHRDYDDGIIKSAGVIGSYWSSTVNGTNSFDLDIYFADATLGGVKRAFGLSVRCIKD